ncbi:MAG: hypothetical protein ACRED5_17990 [Propylenella sp.]
MTKIALGVAALLIGSVASAGQAADRANQAVAAPQAFPNLTLIYAMSGVRDSGSADNTGVATTLHCTNFTSSTQQIRFVVRNFNGAVVANLTSNIGALVTVTRSTHGTAMTEDLPHLAPGVLINQGAMTIATTAANFTCTAQTVDAASGLPLDDLHLTRFASWPGSQE